MAYKHETTRRYESETFPGVVFYLNKMTEGRRVELRSRMVDANKKIRDIMREQDTISKQPEEQRDNARWMELTDEFDGLMFGVVNPEWVKWGVKKIEGLESDGKPLGVEDHMEWPSGLFDEVVSAVKKEAELNGSEAKNFQLRSTSGSQGTQNPSSMTAESASEKDTGSEETAPSSFPVQ